MRAFLAILMAFLTISAATAAVETKTTTKTATGEGTGLTREEAVNNAIIEAIGKMSGVRISSQQLSATSVKSDNSGANISDHYAKTINKATKGRANSYEILDASETDGRWSATVEIKKTTTTKKYKTPGLSADSRRSITVFESSDARFRDSKLGQDLQQKIITELLNSRKFNVLDRDSGGYYEMEKAIIRSGDAASDEVYRLKNVLATDYILLFAINDTNIKSKTSNLTGKTKNTAEVLVDYRVLLFATRQIKFSNTLNMQINVKDDGGLETIKSITDQIAAKIASDILNAIYPLKIADINGEEVVFSQSVKEGESYECFSLGKAIKDSYTGETTGHIETKTGAVLITRSTPKLSYAKITEGSAKKGDVCRPLGGGSGPGYSEGKDANYQLGENGGVELGW